MPRLIPKRTSLVVLAGAAAVAMAGCGGDKEQPAGASSTGEQATAQKGASDPRAAIQEWFTAKRLGEAEAGCALETENFQTLQYDAPGQPCLDDAANKQPQAVWAETIKIVSLEESADSALATIQPNAGSAAEAQVGLVKADGAWLIDTFR